MKDFPMQREWFVDQAKRRVSLGSDPVGDRQGQQAAGAAGSDQENGRGIAQSYEHPEEVVRWYYAQPQRLQEVEGVAIEDNVVAWALSAG
jgi:trigger factor